MENLCISLDIKWIIYGYPWMAHAYTYGNKSWTYVNKLVDMFRLAWINIKFSLFIIICLNWLIKDWGLIPIWFSKSLEAFRCWPNVWPWVPPLLQIYFSKNKEKYELIFKYIIFVNLMISNLENCGALAYRIFEFPDLFGLNLLKRWSFYNWKMTLFKFRNFEA